MVELLETYLHLVPAKAGEVVLGAAVQVLKLPKPSRESAAAHVERQLRQRLISFVTKACAPKERVAPPAQAADAIGELVLHLKAQDVQAVAAVALVWSDGLRHLVAAFEGWLARANIGLPFFEAVAARKPQAMRALPWGQLRSARNLFKLREGLQLLGTLARNPGFVFDGEDKDKAVAPAAAAALVVGAREAAAALASAGPAKQLKRVRQSALQALKNVAQLALHHDPVREALVPALAGLSKAVSAVQAPGGAAEHVAKLLAACAPQKPPSPKKRPQEKDGGKPKRAK